MGKLPGANWMIDGTYFAPGGRFLFSNSGFLYCALDNEGFLTVAPGSSPQSSISDPPKSTGVPLWSTPRQGDPPQGAGWRIVLRKGVLSLYSESDDGEHASDPVWSSGPPSSAAVDDSYCILQDDGYLCIYNPPPGGLGRGDPPSTTGTSGALWHSTVPTDLLSQAAMRGWVFQPLGPETDDPSDQQQPELFYLGTAGEAGNLSAECYDDACTTVDQLIYYDASGASTLLYRSSPHQLGDYNNLPGSYRWEAKWLLYAIGAIIAPPP